MLNYQRVQHLSSENANMTKPNLRPLFVKYHLEPMVQGKI